MHIHLLFWYHWSVQKMFISFLMSLTNSLGMGSIVAKTGCKMPLFRLGDFKLYAFFLNSEHLRVHQKMVLLLETILS
jgi:hypothetical protein